MLIIIMIIVRTITVQNSFCVNDDDNRSDNYDNYEINNSVHKNDSSRHNNNDDNNNNNNQKLNNTRSDTTMIIQTTT